MNISDLKQGDVLTNSEIVSMFNVSNTGGMRKSNKNNVLVIIADHTKSTYDDRWIGKTFHYTGMGLEGDQKLDYAQNRTISESKINGINIHLFEVFDKNEYEYQGVMELDGEPYTEKQPDRNNSLREVYVFPLKLANYNEQAAIKKEKIEQLNFKRKKDIKKISTEALLDKIKNVPKKPGDRRVLSKQFERNQFIVEYVKRNSNGICALCEKDAPFKDRDGNPFLEVHHIKWLSKGGEDTIQNTVAICPNCHKKLHVLNLGSDVEKLLEMNKVN